MIRALALAAALLLAPAAATAQAYPTQPGIGTPKPFTVPASESYRLPNGMQVTLIPYGSVPKATVSLRVYAGGLNEGEQTWISTLTNQLMREGAAGRTGAQIAEAAADMGGNLGGGADAHETVFAIGALSEQADEAVKLIADVVRRPTFPESELDRLRRNALRNLAVAKSQPDTAADVALAAAYYGPGHPYGRILPSEAQLGAYTLDDIRRFHAANFGARRARLYIAGRFDAATVRAAIDQAFADWQSGPERLRLPAQPQPGPKVILVDRPGASQTTIRLAFAAPVAGSQGDLPFRVTNALIGGSFTSRLTKNLREDKGYTYSPFSGVAHNPGQSLWAFEADVTTDVTGASLRETFKEIRRLQTEAPAEEEAAGMRTWMAGTFVLQNASPGGLIGGLSHRDFHGLPANWLQSYIPGVLGVQAADMRRIATEQFPLDRMTLVLVGDLAKIRPQLADLPELGGTNPQLVTIN